MFKIFFLVTWIFINIKICSSCMRMTIGGGGDIPITTTIAPITTTPILVCSTCSQATVITGSGTGTDQPVTQISGTNANRCRTVTVTCTSPNAGQEVNLFLYNNGADLGTISAPTTVTRTLVCNSNGALTLTENGVTEVINQVECISAPVTPVCSTCAAQVAVITGSGAGKDEPITQVPGTHATGCRTVAVTCTAETPGTEIFYLWKLAGVERGTSSATTTITRNLVCNDMGQFVLTEPDTMGMGVVDQVECISATVDPVCSTCAAQVAVITGSGAGKDEPITQVPGTDANGCRTVAVTCTAETPGTEIFYLWKLAGAERGTSSATTTITRNLVCNNMGQFVLTEPDTMGMGVVDQVECISATVEPVCSTCAAQVTVITGTGIGKNEPVTQVGGTDANGCDTLAVTCTAEVPGTQLSYLWKFAGADRAISMATTTLTRNLVCNDMAQYVLTEGGTPATVDQVECVSPLVCSTCALVVAVITGSGVGNDEPITQVPGTNANGCRTVTVTCTTQTPGRELFLSWRAGGADRGTLTGTTTISRTLVCNEMGQFVLTEAGVSATVDQVECISPPIPPCQTCATQVTVITGSGIGTDRPVTQIPGQNAEGCNTVTVSCTTPVMGQDIFYFWMLSGDDRGFSDGVTTISRVLTCNNNAELELTEPMGTDTVNEVQCITPI